jgi:hypothetical protein
VATLPWLQWRYNKKFDAGRRDERLRLVRSGRCSQHRQILEPRFASAC